MIQTTSRRHTEGGIASAAVYTNPTWSDADAPPLPWSAEPAPPPPNSHSEAGYWIAFSSGVKDFGRASGFAYRP